MASVQLKRRGKTPGRWYATYRINGKQRSPFTGLTEETATRKQALKVARELCRIDTQAALGEINKAGIKKAVERMLESHGLYADPRWNTLTEKFLALKEGKAIHANYERIIRYFNEYLNKPSLEVEEIDETDIIGFLTWLQQSKNHTANSQNYALSVLRMIFHMAHEDGLITRNPTRRIEKQIVDKVGKRPFTQKEITAMLSIASDEWKTAILIAQWTGARLGDATRMRGQNFHLDCETPYIRYTPSKTSRKKKNVEIPLYPPLLAHVRQLPSKGLLTPTLRKDPRGFNKIITVARIKRINLRPESSRPFYDAGFHSFRHTFNAFLKKQNVPDWLRMEIIGWSTDEQKKYGRLTIGEVARMVGLKTLPVSVPPV